MILLESYEPLIKHELLRGFKSNPKESFWDGTNNKFMRKHHGDAAEPLRKRLVNVARVAQTAQAVPSWAAFRDPAIIQIKESLPDAKKAGELFSIFEDEEKISAAYSTSKILLGTGVDTESIFGKDGCEKIAKDLLEVLNLLVRERPDAYSGIVLLICQALQKVGVIPGPDLISVHRWAERLLYKCKSAILANNTGAFSPLVMAAAIIALGLTPIDTTLMRERETGLEMLIKTNMILPDEAPRSVVRAGMNAIGYSSFDAMIDLLVDRHMSQIVLQKPEYLMGFLSWLDGHQRRDNDGNILFYTDVYPADGDCELWFNATVQHFLFVLKEGIVKSNQSSILSTLGSRQPRDDVKWTDLAIGDYKWIGNLATELFAETKERSKKGEEFKKNGIILFGPPGTGKTTVADALAIELGGWPVVRIDPELLLQEGRDRIFYWIRKTFDLLSRLKDAVVIFDEFELMVLDRDNNEGAARFAGWETGLVTDVMLPKLQDLHNHGRIIYILATNDIDKIDSAIWRDGRFDYRLPVGPPTRDQKKTIVSNKLGTTPWVVDALVDIPHRLATIGELLGWCNELIKLPAGDLVVAKKIWDERFARALRLSDKDIKKLSKQQKKYATMRML